MQRRIGFYEGKQIFINNLTKALQYRMITISVMIINIKQDAGSYFVNDVLVICYSK